jgi:Tol biopolymer transport system component
MLPIQSHKKILLSLLCLLSLTALTGCAPKSNHFGVILISNNVVGPTDLYRIPDNTQNKVEQLTFTPTIGEYYFLVSKSGDKVVFETGFTELAEDPSDLAIEEHNHIYILDTTSKKLKDITEIFTLPPTTSPMRVVDWSPDQKQFAVITYEGGLQFVDTDGTNRKDILIPSLGKIPDIKAIKWSPDGKKLALIHGYAPETPQHVGWALLIYDLGSGKLRQLTDYQTNCVEVKWSSTSQQVAATCANILPYTEIPAPDTIRIFSAENPGQPYERLALSTCQYPSWSPDGKQIAFTCDKGTDQMGLFIINSDGNGIREVKLGNLESPVVLRYPIWSPDGTQIIYVAGTDSGHENIYSVNLDGSNNHPLTHQAAGYQVISVYPLP